MDSETGLRLNGARYVDGDRFISQDPIGFAGGDSNLYRYVGNSPLIYTDPTGFDLLNNVDRFTAGFGDAVTFGGTSWLREKLYGEQATRNHEGAAFTAGQITGGIASLATGFGTPANFAKGLGWAQKAAIGYDVASTGYGAYNATSKLQQGCATPLDALNFLPAVNYGASRLNDVAHGLDDVGRSLDDVPPLGGRGPTPIDSNDRNFQYGTHLGESSGRPFNPDNIGLPISPRQLSSDKVKITKQGIDKVEQHMNKFPEDAWNVAQIKRLREIEVGTIKPSKGDLNIYTHELRESFRYKKLGYPDAVPKDKTLADKVWNNTHTATLEDYGIKDRDLYDTSVRAIPQY